MAQRTVVRWIAVGLDDHGRFIGLTPIRFSAAVTPVAFIHTEAALVTLKERSITSTPTRALKTDAAAPPKKSLTSWGAPDLHAYFQGRMRKRGFGYPGLSAKDNNNWDLLISGFSIEDIVAIIDHCFDHTDELRSAIPTLPSGPLNVGIVRAWAPSILSHLRGDLAPPSKKSGVREFSKSSPKKEKF